MFLAAALMPILLCSLLISQAYVYALLQWGCDDCRPSGLLGYIAYMGSFTCVVISWAGLYFGIKTYLKLQWQTQETLQAHAMAHQAQLKMLRYQLNPHFLFNTLNAISTLIFDQDSVTANRMVTSLSAFLRYSLDADPVQRVTLKQELEALRLYLGIEKLRAISEHASDLMFLDVQMPGLDGFATLRAIPAGQMPLVVFVSACDHYAIRAFEASAVDYLLKPIDHSRFAQAIHRVREAMRDRESETHYARLLGLLGELSGRPSLTLDEALAGDSTLRLTAKDVRVAIKDGSNTVRIESTKIRWIDAAGDYMCIHTETQTHVLRATMRELEVQLDPRQFQRVHRSTIVNLSRVRSFRAHINGEYLLVLDSGHEVKLSRSYKDKIAILR